MALSSRSPLAFLFLAAACAASVLLPGARPGEAGSVGVGSDDNGIVLKLRRPVDVAALLAARLSPATPSARGWRPSRLRDPFARRSGRPSARDTRLDRVFASDLPPGLGVENALARLSNDPDVEYAQRDYVREPHEAINEPFYQSSGSWGQPYDDLWNLKKLGLEQAWDLAKGSDVVVAVVDSGIDSNHSELEGMMWVNPDEQDGRDDNGFPGDVQGWDFVANDRDPRDEFGHGTHMAGIIAARLDGRGTVGVSPLARLMAVRSIRGAGAGNSSTIAAGIVYAADNGAQVIVVSSGCITRCPSDPIVESAVRHAVSRGAIVVVSAGNRGDDIAFYSPQNMVDPRPIVVAATNPLDRRASFGNIGELVDIVAPGGGTNVPPPAFEPVSNVLSLSSSLCAPLVCQPPFLVGGGSYLRRQGTSMAAAHVAGVVALLLDADPFDDVDAVRERLYGNALDLGPAGHEAMFGWGRLRAMDAVADVRRYVLARITSPAQGQIVRGVVRIAGAAAARAFDRYEITVGRGTAPTSWETGGLSAVGRPTPQGDLATWNTFGLTPGPWTIRLNVHDRVAGRREYRRLVQVDGAPLPWQLVVDVASERRGAGTVHVSPARAFCDAVVGSTQRCVYAEPDGARLTLTAVPARLSTFMGWTGACSGIGTCTVDVSRVHSVRATFQGPYQVRTRVRSVGGGSGDIVVSETTPPDGTCGESCFLLRPNRVVRLEAFYGPLSSIGFDTPGCSGRECVVTVDGNTLIEATAYRFDHPGSSPWVYAPRDQRVSAGELVTLTGHVGTVFPAQPVFPVTVDWFKDTGEFLGTSRAEFPGTEIRIQARFSVGVHTINVSAVDSADPVPNFEFHQFRIIAQEP